MAGKRAIVLAGGGSRGSYQLGVWRALRELGVDFSIVSGTSVGALNGALMAQGDFGAAEQLWLSIKNSSVMSAIPDHDPADKDDYHVLLPAFWKEIQKNGGIDIAPLDALVHKVIDEERLRASHIRFGFVTVRIPTLQPLELMTEDIPDGRVADYLLASAACFPAFKPRSVEGAVFIDGGYYNNLPIDIALSCGADDVIAIDLEAIGYVQPVKVDVPIRYIRSYWPLGLFIVFDPEVAARNMRLGYLDCMKAFEQYDGIAYTFYPGEYHRLARTLMPCMRKMFRFSDESAGFTLFGLGKLAENAVKRTLKHRRSKNMSTALAILSAAEIAAELLDLSPLEIYTMKAFNCKVSEAFVRTAQAAEAAVSAASGAAVDLELVRDALTRKDHKALLPFAYRRLCDAMARRDANAVSLLALIMPREFIAAAYIYALKIY